MSAHFYCGKNIKGTDKLRIGWIANRWERPSSCSGLKQADDDDEAIFKGGGYLRRATFLFVEIS